MLILALLCHGTSATGILLRKKLKILQRLRGNGGNGGNGGDGRRLLMDGKGRGLAQSATIYSCAIAFAAASGDANALASAFTDSRNYGQLAAGLNDAYYQNPTATSNAVAKALSIAEGQGQAQAAAQATSFAIDFGGGAGLAFSSAFSKAGSNQFNKIIPFLPGNLLPRLGLPFVASANGP